MAEARADSDTRRRPHFPGPVVQGGYELDDMEMSELISRHGLEVALWRNDVPYFDRDLAVAAVDACEKEGVAILGVEGFQVDQGAIIPRTDWIADFSTYSRSLDHSSFVAKSAEYARAFLGLPDSEDVLFEFCVR